MDIQVILIIAAVIAAIFLYVVIREKINLQKAADGEDMERLKKTVAHVLPSESGYRVAYGHYEHVVHAGRRTTTTYYCYALAFTSDRLWVIPLGFEKELILPGRPILLTSDMLGIAAVEVAAGREDTPRRVDLSLYDKGGEKFLDCVVEAENTREDRFHHMNILQPEETAQFARFMTALSGQVIQENGGLRERVQSREKGSRRANLFGTLGLVLAFFFPPAGLALSVLGARALPRAPGERAPAPLVLCRIGAAVSIVFLVIWAAAIAAAILT